MGKGRRQSKWSFSGNGWRNPTEPGGDRDVQGSGSKEPITQESIDAQTTNVVYLDTRTDEGITQFLDMVSGDGEIMWLQEEEGEEDKERAESPSGGRSSGAIAE